MYPFVFILNLAVPLQPPTHIQHVAPGLSFRCFTAVYTVLRRATAACHVKHSLSVQHVYFCWLLKQPCYTEPDLCWLLFAAWRIENEGEHVYSPYGSRVYLPLRSKLLLLLPAACSLGGLEHVRRMPGWPQVTARSAFSGSTAVETSHFHEHETGLKLLCLITPSMHPKHWAQNICTSHKEKLCSLLGNLRFLHRPEEQ